MIVIKIEGIPGRRFAANEGQKDCNKCVFNPKSSSTMTLDEQCTGCCASACAATMETYKEVGYDPSSSP